MRTLLLNASTLPLAVISDKRAVRLILDGRVQVLENYDTPFRSGGGMEMPTPCVVMLNEYIDVPYKRPQVTRSGIFARDNNECQYCGREAENIDHVVPRSKGGKHEWTNVVAACIPCNSSKADKMLADTGMKLRKMPVQPRLHHRFFAYDVPAWEPFLR
jgi:5-methylcytosine-specific restriction endonuclease McrA